MKEELKRFLSFFLAGALSVLPNISANATVAEGDFKYEKTIRCKIIFTSLYNYDAQYIYRNTSACDKSRRVCSNNSELVYKFNLSEFSEPVFYFEVVRNYLLQASSDDTTYTTVADYDKITTNGRISDDSNLTSYSIDPKDFGCTDTLYVRLANTASGTTDGGTIRSIIISEKLEDTTKPVVDMYGDLDNNNDVSAADALVCLQNAVGKRELNIKEVRTADVNGNKRIGADDALLILQKAVKKISVFPVEKIQTTSKILKNGSHLLFLGDSITDWYRDKEDPDSIGNTNGYMYILNNMQEAFFPDMNLKVYNRGFSGYTSAQVADIADKFCQETKPDVVTVMVGINDVITQVNKNPVTTEEYGQNMTKIIKTILANGAVPVVMSPFAFPAGDTNGWRGKQLQEMINECKRVSEELGAIYIPLDDIFINEWKGLEVGKRFSYDDGVHTDTLGNKIIATEWLNMAMNN